jgi:hypothetical protein
MNDPLSYPVEDEGLISLVLPAQAALVVVHAAGFKAFGAVHMSAEHHRGRDQDLKADGTFIGRLRNNLIKVLSGKMVFEF